MGSLGVNNSLTPPDSLDSKTLRLYPYGLPSRLRCLLYRTFDFLTNSRHAQRQASGCALCAIDG